MAIRTPEGAPRVTTVEPTISTPTRYIDASYDSPSRALNQSAAERDINWIQEQQQLAQQMRMRDESLIEFNKIKEASSAEVWAAAFTTENSLGSWIAREPMPKLAPVDGYNPFDQTEDGTTDITGYEPWADLFVESQSPQETAIIKERIKRENKNRMILQESPVEGFIAALAAGITDPINLALMAIPVAGQANLGRTMAVAGVSAAVTEVPLHLTQETRTIEESVANSIGSALLSGVLGKAAQGLTKAQEDAILKEIVGEVTANPRSVGAMEAGDTGAEVVLNGPLSRMAALLTKITPLGRALQSEVEKVRSTMQKLSDSSIHLEGAYVPTSAESLIKSDYARFDIATIEVRQLQQQWKKRTGMRDIDFNRELIRAMRRGDEHMDPDIMAAAQRLRKEMDILWNRAYEANLAGTYRMVVGESGESVKAPIETKTAKSYMTRRYDLNVIRNNPEGFKRAWMNAIRDQRIRDGVAPLDEADLYEVAADIYEKVINMYDGDLHFNIGPSGAAMLKERVDVKDEFLEEFLVTDWEQLMLGYVKSLSPRVRLAEVFGEGDGDFTMKSAINTIRQDYALRVNALDKEIDKLSGSAKKAAVRKRDKLMKKMETELRDIEIVRDRLLNVTQETSWMNPENRGVLSALRSARSWNIVASLSNIVISSIPDLARLITYHGGRKFAKAFVRSAFSKSLVRSNLPKNELAKIASAMERASAYRIGHLTEVEDGIVYTRADKYMHKAADAVLTLSGSKHWNSVGKTIVGHLVSDKIGLALRSGDVATLKRLGLTDDAIKIAKEQFAKYGTNDDGLWNLNIDRWEHRNLVETIEAAAIREADAVVVTPGAGDKPILMTTEIGRTIFQFMSFMVSATNKMTLPLMQEKGLRPWMEIITQIGLGAAVYYLKQIAAGKEPSTDPEVVLQEAVANTGLLGYASQMYSASTAMMGVNPLSDEGVYYQHNGLSRILGPSAGLVENLLRIPNAQTSDEQRAKAVRRLMPMQNHFILRKGYDEVEKQMAELFGTVGGDSGQPNL